MSALFVYSVIILHLSNETNATINHNSTYPFEPVLEKVDFDESMKSGTPIDHFIFRHEDSNLLYNTYKDLYNQNFNSTFTSETKIPRILHYLWIGNAEIPPTYLRY